MTKIPWTDESWNPIRYLDGWHCTKIATGCQNCYAEIINNRFGNHIPYHNLLNFESFHLNNNILEKPLHWRKPRMIFLCSMCDLFHPKVPIGHLTHIFDIIQQCPQHIIQILTKRPQQALKMMWGRHGEGWRYFGDGDYYENIWFGTSISTQPDADKNIPILLKIPATVRYVSVEPMIERIDISKLFDNYYLEHTLGHMTFIDWVIIGCESGAKRRPCKLEWVKDLIEQCDAAGVPVFVKQLDINGKCSKKPEEWPEWARRQEYPNGKAH